MRDWIRTVVLVLLVGMAGCSGGTPDAPRPDPPEAEQPAAEPPAAEPLQAEGCQLPWASMAQVVACASDGYTEASDEGNQIHVVIPSTDPETIAAALAGAFLDNEANAEQIVVWAYSDASVIGTGYDRGVLSEQGTLGELLVFEVCTSWDEFPDIGEICGEREEFTIEQ